jgi:lantibiotic modifying enzyme
LTGDSVPEPIIERFRKEALESGSALPPGLHLGSAGVACVLADLGHVDDAGYVLDQASRHPVLQDSATLGDGLAGVGLAHLRMYRVTGSDRHMDHAVQVAERIASRIRDDTLLGRVDPTGLLSGRSGIALFLHRLARESGAPDAMEMGRQLLHDELKRAVDQPYGALSFPEDARARRIMPYLSSGSAGVALALTRYAVDAPDEQIVTALPRVLKDIDKMVTVMPGLYGGLAGLAFALADHSAATGSGTSSEAALRVASGLVKYAVPDSRGVRFLGDGTLRFSAELWSGSAGVLLAVDRVLHGSSGHLLLD